MNTIFIDVNQALLHDFVSSLGRTIMHVEADVRTVCASHQLITMMWSDTSDMARNRPRSSKFGVALGEWTTVNTWILGSSQRATSTNCHIMGVNPNSCQKSNIEPRWQTLTCDKILWKQKVLNWVFKSCDHCSSNPDLHRDRIICRRS